MQMSSRKMHMRKKFVMPMMHGFALACLMSNLYRICRCECSGMMVQMKTSYFANVFQEKTYANLYTRDVDV